MPTIRLMLDLHTNHLPEDTCDDLNGFDTSYGWLMWVPDDIDTHGADYDDIPAEVVTIWRYARSLDCGYVLFDRDAAHDGQLPSWDW
jgi:hypothetical protein